MTALPSIEAILGLGTPTGKGGCVIWGGKTTSVSMGHNEYVYPYLPQFGMVRPLLYKLCAPDKERRRVLSSCTISLCISLEHLYVIVKKMPMSLATLQQITLSQAVGPVIAPPAAKTLSASWADQARQFMGDF